MLGQRPACADDHSLAQARYRSRTGRPGRVDEQVLSLLDLSATTLCMAGIPKPFGMQSRVFLGANAEPPRTYAFAARDRIDETEVRLRSVHDARFHYIRNYTPGAGFPTLNRYKEKCFLVKTYTLCFEEVTNCLIY